MATIRRTGSCGLVTPAATWLVVAVSWLVVPVAPLSAQARGSDAREGARALPSDVVASRAPYRIIYDHITGEIILESPRGAEQDRWQRWQAGAETAPLAEVPPDRPVQVVVRNANPLLYTYGVDAPVVASRNARTCRELTSGFTQRGFLIGMGALRGVTPAAPPDGNLFRTGEDLFGGGQSQLTRSGDSAPALNASQAEAALRTVRPAVERHISFLQSLSATAIMLEDSIAGAAELAESVPLDSILRGLQQRLEAMAPGLSDPARVRAIVLSDQAQVGGAMDALAEITSAVREGSYNGPAGSGAAAEAMLLEARLVNARQQAAQSYRPLQQALLRLQRMRAETTQSFMIAASRDVRRLSLHLGQAPGYDDMPRLREGTVDVYVTPSTPVLCDISLGFGWMDAPPQFAVRNGALAETTSQDPRVTPSLLFHLAHDRLPLLGVSAGIGVGQHSRPDFYLGGTFRYLEPVMLNYGWVWQRGPVLADGMAIGAPMTAEELDDLDMRYRRAVFIGLSLSIAGVR